MELNGKKIGFAMTGSYCTFSQVFRELLSLNKLGAEIYPIISENVSKTNCRFIKAEELYDKLQAVSGREVIDSIVKAEPIGPLSALDILIVAPCTGNTLSKIALGITDTPVVMAVKAQLRNQKPVLLAAATNDALAATSKNIGLLLNTKNIYLVPLRQDSPEKKPDSLVAKMDLIIPSAELALEGRQYQPFYVN